MISIPCTTVPPLALQTFKQYQFLFCAATTAVPVVTCRQQSPAAGAVQKVLEMIAVTVCEVPKGVCCLVSATPAEVIMLRVKSPNVVQSGRLTSISSTSCLVMPVNAYRGKPSAQGAAAKMVLSKRQVSKTWNVSIVVYVLKDGQGQVSVVYLKEPAAVPVIQRAQQPAAKDEQVLIKFEPVSATLVLMAAAGVKARVETDGTVQRLTTALVRMVVVVTTIDPAAARYASLRIVSGLRTSSLLARRLAVVVPATSIFITFRPASAPVVVPVVEMWRVKVPAAAGAATVYVSVAVLPTAGSVIAALACLDVAPSNSSIPKTVGAAPEVDRVVKVNVAVQPRARVMSYLDWQPVVTTIVCAGVQMALAHKTRHKAIRRSFVIFETYNYVDAIIISIISTRPLVDMMESTPSLLQPTVKLSKSIKNHSHGSLALPSCSKFEFFHLFLMASSSI